MNGPLGQIFQRSGPLIFCNRRLYLMLAVSLLVHLFLAYAVLVNHPPVVMQFPQDARLSLATPANSPPELIDWILQSDSAGIFRPIEPQEEEIGFRYVPSFQTAIPEAIRTNPAQPEVTLPLLRPPNGILREPAPKARSRPSLPPVKLALSCSRGDPVVLPLLSDLPEGFDLSGIQNPAEFWIVRDAELLVPLTVILKSSGSAAFDRLCLERLRGEIAAGKWPLDCLSCIEGRLTREPVSPASP